MIFRGHPLLAPYLISGYKHEAKRSDYVTANIWLREIRKRLQIGGTPLTVGSEDEAIRDYSKAISKSMSHEILPTLRMRGPVEALRMVTTAIRRAGVDLGVNAESSEQAIEGALKRACDDKWWFRKLRGIQRRGFEAIVRELGYVNSKHNIYVSDLTLQRRAAQRQSNRALLSRMVAENEDGQKYTLEELSDLSTSNPILRRAELMVRMRGLEDVANASPEQYTGMLYTLTCPSKYHAVLSSGPRNPKFGGATPLEAHGYLNTVWARTRSAWAKAGYIPLGCVWLSHIMTEHRIGILCFSFLVSWPILRPRSF